MYKLDSVFRAMVDHFLMTDELGHYNPDNRSIQLYDVPATRIPHIRKECSAITTKYRLIILSPGELFTNINILDIGL